MQVVFRFQLNFLHDRRILQCLWTLLFANDPLRERFGTMGGQSGPWTLHVVVVVIVVFAKSFTLEAAQQVQKVSVPTSSANIVTTWCSRVLIRTTGG